MKRQEWNENWVFKAGGKDEEATVTLPHDAMQTETRTPDSPGGSAVGFYPPNKYTYEKTLKAPAEWEGKSISLQFEGVFKNSRVYVNGKEAGGAAFGYVPFFVQLDEHLKYGADNSIRVEADNSEMPNSRWYTGAGIYRPVWLWLGEKAHIQPEGIRVTPLSYNPAKIRVDIEATGGDAFQIEILDGGGNVVAKASDNHAEIEIPEAKLWDENSPCLYTCRAALLSGGKQVDTAEERFGIRIVEWSPAGLLINGKETLLRGGCVHHDNGILGARSYAESERRRVRKLKEAGYNAIRSSHNPAAKAMLEACDEYGVYMMDETWDMWYGPKNKFDYSKDFMENYKYDIEALVARDYNHPSVIMYSIGNEVGEPATDKGVELAKEMIAMLKGLDSTRPVTCGVNLMIISMAKKGRGLYKDDGSGLANNASAKRDSSKKQKASGSLFFNILTSFIGTGMNRMANSKSADRATSPVLDALDIAGYNYASGRYKLEGKAHPDRVVFGSETFPRDIAKNWAMVKKYPYLIGDFMWTSWDYLGEAGIGAWSYDGTRAFAKPFPWLLADMGAFDILGNPCGQVYRTQAVWEMLEKPAISVQPVNHPGVRPGKSVWRGTNALPSWSWKGCNGNKALVEVYSSKSSVELLLNGKSLGRKKVKKCLAQFSTKYAPGNLTAIEYDESGKETGRNELESATGAIGILITPEKQCADPGEVIYVNIEMAGENSIVEMNADALLSVTVDGGELLAFGSANPAPVDDYNTGSFTTYYGRAQAIIRAGSTGNVRITASGDGLTPASLEIVVS